MITHEAAAAPNGGYRVSAADQLWSLSVIGTLAREVPYRFFALARTLFRVVKNAQVNHFGGGPGVFLPCRGAGSSGVLAEDLDQEDPCAGAGGGAGR